MIFLKRQSRHGEVGRQRFCHITDMPGHLGKAGDGSLISRIAENKSVERSMSRQPDAFRRSDEIFCQMHLNGRAGKIQSKTALMLAGSGSGYVRISGIKLRLPGIGTVSGNAAQVQAFPAAPCDQFQSGPGGGFLQKTLLFARQSVERKSDIHKSGRDVLFRQRMFPVDQPGINFIHKNPPSPSIL